MTININTFLQDYLETNNTKVIGYIPAFIELAITRINRILRNSFLEVNVANNPLVLAADFVAARSLTVNGTSYHYDTSGIDGTFNIVANAIVIAPVPAVTDIISFTYYGINQSILTSYSPQLLIHGAASEAYMYIGDVETCSTENQLFMVLIDEAGGWDSQGTISIGGITGSI